MCEIFGLFHEGRSAPIPPHSKFQMIWVAYAEPMLHLYTRMRDADLYLMPRCCLFLRSVCLCLLTQHNPALTREVNISPSLGTSRVLVDHPMKAKTQHTQAVSCGD